MTDTGFRIEGDWIIDARNNRASITLWGSEEEAIKALKTCTDCSYCRNCTDCTGCRDCRDCTGCRNCRDCTGCRNCRDCTYCTDCTTCTYCSYCTDCTACSNCRRCADCTYCRRCTDCTTCTSKNGEFAGGEAPLVIPKIDRLHTKVLAAASVPGALDMSEWHACGTCHCRAGWIVHLAGDEGRALESELSTEFAALLIASESGHPISPSRFYDSDEDALKDMKRMANLEASQ